MIRKIWKVLNRASNSNLYLFLQFCVRIIIVPLTYLLWFFEPFIKIRLYKGETKRIGHLASTFEVLIRTKEIDLLDKKTLNIFIVDKYPINKTLYNMWKEHIYFIENNMLTLIYHFCVPWLRNRKHFCIKNVDHGGLPPSKPTLSFTKEQNIQGHNLAKNMGIDKDDWFVCLHNRSSMYLKTIRPTDDFSYHNLRDCSFEMLYESAKLIMDKGGKCIRMSSGEQNKLSINAPSNIIDYAGKCQSDFMDIYLPTKCKFMIGAQSGLIEVSKIFNIPTGITNMWPLIEVGMNMNSLYIPKLLWSIEDKKFLSYKEIVDYNLGKYDTSADYISHGLELVENDADDIKLLTLDMFDLENNKKLSIKDENIRNDFMNKYFIVPKFVNKHSSDEGLKFSGKISWRFLNKHSYLMNN
jgi:putative glycosyltransferase (TIGR04372 family)